jgi:hypothetical protein
MAASQRYAEWWPYETEDSDERHMLVEPLLDDFAISSEANDGLSLEEKLDDLFHRYSNQSNDDACVINSILEYTLLQPGRIDDVVLSGENLLHIAARKGQLKSINMLIENTANPNPIDLRNGNTPLHFAAIGGFPECISALLHGGADPSIRNFSADKTPLHYASEYGYDKCIEIILEFSHAHGVTAELVNMRDINGLTALHLAGIDGNIAAVKILLSNHADVVIEDCEGRNAYDIVKNLPGREAVVKELKKKLPRGHRSLLPNTPTPNESTSPTPAPAAVSNSGLFDGMNLSSSSLFDGLSLKPFAEGRDIEDVVVPEGRWVVYQGKMFIADRTTGKVIVHRDR